MDPSKSIALSSDAVALRVETEDSHRRAPLPAPGVGRRQRVRIAYREALRYAEIARQLLNFHAAMGSRKPGQVSPPWCSEPATPSWRTTWFTSSIASRSAARCLVFAHNSHLQRGEAAWPGQKYWGTDDDCQWWPAGSHLAEILGPRYAVIGTAVGLRRKTASPPPKPEPWRPSSTRIAHSALLLPISGAHLRDLPTRSGSSQNPTYVPSTAGKPTHFDWIRLCRQLPPTISAARRCKPWDAKPDKKDAENPNGQISPAGLIPIESTPDRHAWIAAPTWASQAAGGN